MVGVRRMAQRGGWVLVDQALSSLTNFVLAVLVARSVSTREFGAFAIVLATYQLLQGAMRAIATGPHSVRYSATPELERRWADKAATGVSLVVGIVGGIVTLGVGSLVGGGLGSSLQVLGLLSPGLLLQDAWRFVFITAGRPRAAAFNDLVWAVTQLGAIAWLIIVSDPSVPVLIAVWGISAGVSAVVGAVQGRTVPDPRSSFRWLRTHRDLVPSYLGALGLTLLGSQGLLYSVGAVAGLGATGALKAVQVVLGPLNLLFLTAQNAGVPEAVRLRTSSSGRAQRFAAGLSVFLGVTSLIVGVIVVGLPDSLGEMFMGASWLPAQRLLGPMTFWFAAAGIGTGAVVGLHGHADARGVLQGRAVTAVLLLSLGTGGAAIAGATGAAVAGAIAHAMGAADLWRSLVRTLRRPENRVNPELQ